MRKKKFFSNLGNVAISGLGVTLVCFILYSAAGIALIKMGPIMSNYFDLNNDIVDPNEENPQEIKITIMQMLLFTALLCSSDVVAAVSIVDYTK